MEKSPSSFHMSSLQSLVDLCIQDPSSNTEAVLTHPAHFAPGERLLNIGDKHHNLYFFSKGLLKIVYCDKEGREIIRAFITNGMFYLSLSSYLQNTGALCYVEAIEPCEAEYVSYTVISKGLETSLELNKVWRQYMNQHFVRHERRELELLSHKATQRYTRFLKDYPDLDARLSRNLVASYLGVTEQSLSRIRKGLKT